MHEGKGNNMKTQLSIFAIAFACSGCAANGTPTPQTVAAGVAGVDVAICVLDTAAADEAAGMAWPAIVADGINKCGTDASQVASVIAEARKLAVADTALAAKAKK
jgi:hypothetical protein